MRLLKTNLLMTMIALCLSVTVNAQIVIHGTVTDTEGPLVGATVAVKGDAGNTAGTITDMDGKYSIEVKSKKTVLVFSYIGYTDQMVTVGDRKKIDVRLEVNDTQLDETVVIGYGVQQKSHLTGSISKLDGGSLTKAPVSDVTQALQGMMTGLTVSNETSEVGVTPSIRVRGTGSISAESSPLVIIDGFPVKGGLSQVNASDIKSVEILKDAASAAIYGSRAANGVILITTKQGTPEQPKYKFNFYQGFKYAYQLHDMMTSTDWFNLMQQEEALGGRPVMSQARSAAYLESLYGATDWQKEGLNDVASMTNVQFSVSGGKKDTKYFVSAAYMKDQGIMRSNTLDKVNFRAKLDTRLSKSVGFGVNFSGTYKRAERPRNNFIDFYRTPSFLPVYHNDITTALTGYSGFARGSHFNNIETPTGEVDEEGNPLTERTSPFSSSNNNPCSVMANTMRWSEDFQGLGNLYLTVELAKGLTFKTSNGFNVRFSPSYTYDNKNLNFRK